MLELYQFELSHFCEKIRLILDYKGLPYRKIEVTPGLGQLDVYRLSGQRQVPILKDGNEVIADSTAIADYLEKKYPERPIIPESPKLRGLTLLIEQWADESLAINGRKCMVDGLGKDPAFRRAFLPSTTPDFLKDLLGSVPSELFGALELGVGLTPDAVKTATDAAKRDLTSLCFMLMEQPYLVTDTPTLADFAVAGLSMYLKFPEGSYLDVPEALKGKGVPGIADVGAFEPFFDWRDRLYMNFRKAGTTSPASSGGGPTSINIE
ncbi:glutathione S-transferase family protein [Leptolyngbya sp. AN02str]